MVVVMVTKKKTAVKKKTTKRAAPIKLTKSIANKICLRLSEGESLRSICDDSRLPARSAVMNWLTSDDCVWFKDQYVRAREEGLELMASDILVIADGDQYTKQLKDLRKEFDDCDDADKLDLIKMKMNIAAASQKELANRDKLRVDSRKWLLSKMLPKKYGDKIDVNHGGQSDNPVQSQVTFVGVKTNK